MFSDKTVSTRSEVLVIEKYDSYLILRECMALVLALRLHVSWASEREKKYFNSTANSLGFTPTMMQSLKFKT